MPNGGDIFVGLVTKTTWADNLIIAHGNGVCGTDNTALNDYGIDLIVTDSDGVQTTVATGQTLSCDYMYVDGDIVKRDDTSDELDSKLIKQSTSKKQFIGLKDDLADAMDLVDTASQAGIIVMDKVFRPETDVQDDITGVLRDR